MNPTNPGQKSPDRIAAERDERRGLNLGVDLTKKREQENNRDPVNEAYRNPPPEKKDTPTSTDRLKNFADVILPYLGVKTYKQAKDEKNNKEWASAGGSNYLYERYPKQQKTQPKDEIKQKPKESFLVSILKKFNPFKPSVPKEVLAKDPAYKFDFTGPKGKAWFEVKRPTNVVIINNKIPEEEPSRFQEYRRKASEELSNQWEEKILTKERELQRRSNEPTEILLESFGPQSFGAVTRQGGPHRARTQENKTPPPLSSELKKEIADALGALKAKKAVEEAQKPSLPSLEKRWVGPPEWEKSQREASEQGLQPPQSIAQIKPTSEQLKRLGENALKVRAGDGGTTLEPSPLKKELPQIPNEPTKTPQERLLELAKLANNQEPLPEQLLVVNPSQKPPEESQRETSASTTPAPKSSSKQPGNPINAPQKAGPLPSDWLNSTPFPPKHDPNKQVAILKPAKLGSPHPGGVSDLSHTSGSDRSGTVINRRAAESKQAEIDLKALEALKASGASKKTTPRQTEVTSKRVSPCGHETSFVARLTTTGTGKGGGGRGSGG